METNYEVLAVNYEGSHAYDIQIRESFEALSQCVASLDTADRRICIVTDSISITISSTFFFILFSIDNLATKLQKKTTRDTRQMFHIVFHMSQNRHIKQKNIKERYNIRIFCVILLQILLST